MPAPGVPAKALFSCRGHGHHRGMKERRTRHQFHLPDHLSVRLDGLAASGGVTKGEILTQAFTHWLERREEQAEEESFGRRLGRAAGAIERAERKLDLLTEIVGLLVRHELTLAAHLPPFDASSRRIAQLRYDELVGAAVELSRRKIAGPGRG